MSQLQVGIFGPSLSGKTTLMKHLAGSLFNDHDIRSVALDINGETWPKGTKVFTSEGPFWPFVWSEKSLAVFVDESAETIARDKDKVSLFTRIRHRGHKLFVSGHSGASLLPVMRQQISTLYLFRQPRDAAEMWANQFARTEILAACSLNQYEFLHCELYGPVRRRRLKL